MPQGLGPGGVLLHFSLAVSAVGAGGQNIDFDLGFGARGTDHQGGAVGQLVSQHVGPCQLHGGSLSCGSVPFGAGLVVPLEADRGARDLVGGCLPEI